MKGFPKNLNSKQDYYFIKDNYPVEQWLPYWKDLIKTSYDWFYIRDVDEDENIENNDQYKVIETTQDNKTTRSLYQYKENPSCKIIRLGFDRQEVIEVIELAQ